MKLSTEALKKLITKWLGEAEGAPTREDLEHYAEYNHKIYVSREAGYRERTPEELAQLREEVAKSWNLSKWTSDEELLDRIFDEWRKGENWKRSEKRKVGQENWIEYFGSPDYDKLGRDDPWPPRLDQCKLAEFPIDVCGEHDADLHRKGFEDPKWGARCIYRMFLPRNDHLADNYRLEVITTAEDDAVIGWWITVD